MYSLLTLIFPSKTPRVLHTGRSKTFIYVSRTRTLTNEIVGLIFYPARNLIRENFELLFLNGPPHITLCGHKYNETIKSK